MNSFPENNSPRKNKYFDVYGPVFYPAAGLIIFFIAITLIYKEQMEKAFGVIQTGISTYTGWFFVLLVNVLLIFSLYLAFSKFGKIRLGGAQAKTEFPTWAWFSMLFSAGMGIGLLFYSVAEPILHYKTSPIGATDAIERSKVAMGFTFLHWGLHTWAIYAVVALALAFFTFNRKLPMTIRSIFYPTLGERIHGPIGSLIDVLAVVATVFGLATSLGFGVAQINSGLEYLFQVSNNVTVQVILIALITAAATVSVVTGLDKGVRRLSEMNMLLGLLFLILIIILGPSLFIFDSFVQNIGYYFQNIFEMGLWTEAYQNYSGDTNKTKDWQNGWTVFYWAWWVSWSPFVGIFIARISKGRTVREFILGVLIVPTILTFIWLSAFGGSALYEELFAPSGISKAVSENISTALFVLMERYPLSFFTSLIGIILVTSFFVTSSDSGSLVVDSITAGGKLDAPVGQRIFWAVAEGAVAAVLLLGGGLAALQTGAILTGLPFAIIIVFMMFNLFKGLQRDYEQTDVSPKTPSPEPEKEEVLY